MIKKDSFLYEFLYNEAPKENPDVDTAMNDNPGGNAPAPTDAPAGEPQPGNDVPPANNGGSDMPPMGDNTPQNGGENTMPTDDMGGGEIVPTDNAPADVPPMGAPETPGENETTLDVDDLTQAQEKLNDKVNVLGKNTSNLSGQIEKVASMINTIVNKIEANNKEITDFKAEMERRNPTPKQKLELRTSSPFDMPVDRFWDEFEKTHPNYEIDKNNGAHDKDGEKQYVITRDDVENYDPYEIEQSLISSGLYEEKNMRAFIRKALRKQTK